jgi:hypothetical protein
MMPMAWSRRRVLTLVSMSATLLPQRGRRRCYGCARSRRDHPWRFKHGRGARASPTRGSPANTARCPRRWCERYAGPRAHGGAAGAIIRLNNNIIIMNARGRPRRAHRRTHADLPDEGDGGPLRSEAGARSSSASVPHRLCPGPAPTASQRAVIRDQAEPRR